MSNFPGQQRKSETSSRELPQIGTVRITQRQVPRTGEDQSRMNSQNHVSRESIEQESSIEGIHNPSLSVSSNSVLEQNIYTNRPDTEEIVKQEAERKKQHTNPLDFVQQRVFGHNTIQNQASRVVITQPVRIRFHPIPNNTQQKPVAQKNQSEVSIQISSGDSSESVLEQNIQTIHSYTERKEAQKKKKLGNRIDLGQQRVFENNTIQNQASRVVITQPVRIRFHPIPNNTQQKPVAQKNQSEVSIQISSGDRLSSDSALELNIYTNRPDTEEIVKQEAERKKQHTNPIDFERVFGHNTIQNQASRVAIRLTYIVPPPYSIPNQSQENLQPSDLPRQSNIGSDPSISSPTTSINQQNN